MKSLLFFAITPLLYSSVALSDDLGSCTDQAKTKKIATAATWANLRNKPGSLRFETGEMLKCGLAKLKENQILKIISIPNAFRIDSDDNSYCAAKSEETSKTPLTFDAGQFSALEEINTWIEKFSQGKGEEGKVLYSKCDRSCSPQYTYLITKLSAENLNVSANVICGPARDKDDNQYALESITE